VPKEIFCHLWYVILSDIFLIFYGFFARQNQSLMTQPVFYQLRRRPNFAASLFAFIQENNINERIGK